jgi:hypothetical protein
MTRIVRANQLRIVSLVQPWAAATDSKDSLPAPSRRSSVSSRCDEPIGAARATQLRARTQSQI